MAELWPFVPQREFIESLEWLTDVIVCRSAEQRLGIRPLPRMGLSYDMLLDSRQASLARTLARTASLGEFYVPLWGEATRIGPLPQGSTSVLLDTTWGQYAPGRLVALFDEFDRVEVLQLAAVSASELTLANGTTRALSNAFVMPCAVMRPYQEFEFVRAPAEDLLRVRASFYATDVMDVAADAGSVVYRSHPVLTVQPIAAGSMGERVLHAAETVDNDVGPAAVFKQLEYVTSKAYMAWDCLTVQELWSLRRWLYAVRGKQRGFWRPTWGHDLSLLSPATSGSTSITVADVGFSGRMTDRDLAIRLTDGTTLYRRATQAQAGLAGTEVVQLDAALGVAITPSSVDRISFMNFARLDADRLEIRHRVARGASVQAPIVEVPQP